MLDLTDMQKIGVGLTGFGAVFIFLGVMLFFDRGLLAMGNILFVAGIGFIIGMARTYSFFFQRHKLKGTGFFFAGITIVLIGWPFIGMLVESYGFFLLFRGIFPHAISFLRRAPVLGLILNLPGISRLMDALSNDSNSIV
ncbi:vesicle transport protein GOT1B-like [Dysidea avara]|uniref:vesicle transport protein GOT1B-like n=1 Tax=Dysidea avara TaxID=196820 RepID=UPI00332037B7